MRERPILFNGEMVRAILDSRKTQTRRVVKQRLGWRTTIDEGKFLCEDMYGDWHEWKGPYGQPGDRLWVRETWGFCADGLPNDDRPIHPVHGGCLYRATEPEAVSGDESDMRWKPSIHMPRWASRINLEITNIRVERLNDISEDDACKDGGFSPFTRDCKKPKFKALWESVYGEGSWEENSWVWVIEFKRI